MKKLLFILLFSSPAFGMGNAPPRPDTDPATWGDVKAVRGQVTANAQQEQSDVTAVNNRIDDLNKTKIQIGTTIRIYDAKRLSLNLFGIADIQGSGGNAVGLNIGLKLGKSYEERQIEKLRQQIDYLTSKLNHN